jgi:hypothetical protein
MLGSSRRSRRSTRAYNEWPPSRSDIEAAPRVFEEMQAAAAGVPPDVTQSSESTESTQSLLRRIQELEVELQASYGVTQVGTTWRGLGCGEWQQRGAHASTPGSPLAREGVWGWLGVSTLSKDMYPVCRCTSCVFECGGPTPAVRGRSSDSPACASPSPSP